MDAVPHPVRPVPLNYAWLLILLSRMLLLVVLRRGVASTGGKGTLLETQGFLDGVTLGWMPSRIPSVQSR